MSEQYIRDWRIIFGGGKTLDVSDLRIRFDTHQRTRDTPAYLNVFVYNLSRSTSQGVLNQEYQDVTLEAGYLSGRGIIFKGQILQARTYKENVVDTVLHVIATTWEKARNFATVNKTLSSGHTFADRVDVAVDAMKKYGITVGHIDDLGSRKFPRGFVAFGMAKDMLREVCFATGSSWWNKDGRFYLLKNENTTPGSTIILNSVTGMIGMPEQTIQGVVVRCLLNYRIIPGQKVQINESSINRAAFDPSVSGSRNNEVLKDDNILGLASDGIYKALLVEHNGDTRGPNWYTEIICVKNSGGESPALRAMGVSDDVDDASSSGSASFSNSSIKAGPR